jgi:hypothetical protein
MSALPELGGVSQQGAHDDGEAAGECEVPILEIMPTQSISPD